MKKEQTIIEVLHCLKEIIQCVKERIGKQLSFYVLNLSLEGTTLLIKRKRNSNFKQINIMAFAMTISEIDFIP